jgi:hypothetical protein
MQSTADSHTIAAAQKENVTPGSISFGEAREYTQAEQDFIARGAAEKATKNLYGLPVDATMTNASSNPATYMSHLGIQHMEDVVPGTSHIATNPSQTSNPTLPIRSPVQTRNSHSATKKSKFVEHLPEAGNPGLLYQGTQKEPTDTPKVQSGGHGKIGPADPINVKKRKIGNEVPTSRTPTEDTLSTLGHSLEHPEDITEQFPSDSGSTPPRKVSNTEKLKRLARAADRCGSPAARIEMEKNKHDAFAGSVSTAAALSSAADAIATEAPAPDAPTQSTEGADGAAVRLFQAPIPRRSRKTPATPEASAGSQTTLSPPKDEDSQMPDVTTPAAATNPPAQPSSATKSAKSQQELPIAPTNSPTPAPETAPKATPGSTRSQRTSRRKTPATPAPTTARQFGRRAAKDAVKPNALLHPETVAGGASSKREYSASVAPEDEQEGQGKRRRGAAKAAEEKIVETEYTAAEGSNAGDGRGKPKARGRGSSGGRGGWGRGRAKA